MSFPPYNASVLSQYGSIFRFIPPQVVGGLVRPATPLFLPPTCHRQDHGGNPSTMPVPMGKRPRSLPFVRQRIPRPTRQAASHADFASVRLRHRRRLPGRAVLQLHLTPPTSSPHGIPSPTPTVTVASTNASLPSSSPSSASVNIRYQVSSTS